MKIKDLSISVVSGDLLHLSQPQTSIVLPTNTVGDWMGVVDRLLYSSEVGRNTELRRVKYDGGPTSLYHQQVANYVRGHHEPSVLDGVFLPTYRDDKPVNLGFRHVGFVFDDFKLPLSEVVENALHGVQSFPSLGPLVAMPLMRTGVGFLRAPEMTMEEVLDELAAGIVRFGALSATRPHFELTVVGYQSDDLLELLVQSLSKLGVSGL